MWTSGLPGGSKVAALVAVLLASGLVGCATTSPAPSAAGPAMLPVPTNETDRAYLGLPADATTFRIEDIRADTLVVDFFDMYCHVCQREAHRINEMYLLTQSRGLADRMKFIGLGVGDTQLETDTFKNKFKVRHPVFPDRHAVVTKTFGDIRVPALVVLKRRGDKLEVVHRSSGVPTNAEQFFQTIRPDSTVTDDSPRTKSGLCDTNSPTCRVPPKPTKSN